MESFKNVDERIKHYQTSSNREKFIFGIEPSLNFEMRDFISDSVGDDVPDLQKLEGLVLIEMIEYQGLLDTKDCEQLKNIFDAIHEVKSIEITQDFQEKFGTLEKLLEKKINTLNDADEYFNLTKQLIKKMRKTTES